MKLFLSILSIALLPCSFVNGQPQVSYRDSDPSGGNIIHAGGDTIYSETFVGGMPLGWTQSGTNMDWKYAPSSYAFKGCFTSSLTRVNSTTAVNGTMMFDADSVNRAANDPSCTSGGSAYKTLNGSLITTPYNFTGYGGVHLKFQQRFDLCCTGSSALTVSVSNNGGVSWTDFDARHGVSLNSFPAADPDTIDFNISAVAANKPAVIVRFTFSGANRFFWEIDDIAFTESPNNDIAIQKTFIDFNHLDGGYYTKTPLNQITPLTFRGVTINNGINALTNVKLNVDISNGSSVYNQNSTARASVASLEKDTFKISTPSFTPNLQGTYTTTFTITQNETDDIPASNTLLKIFEVTDTVYARDDNNITGSYYGPTNYPNGGFNEAGLANLYEIYSYDQASSVSFYLESNTDSAAILQADIYLRSKNGSVSAFPVISSGSYQVINPSDKGKWVTLSLALFTGDPSLYKDSSYLVTVKNYNEGVSNQKMRISSDLVTEQPSGVSFVKYWTGSTFAWGSVNTHPRIRLNTSSLYVGVPMLSDNGLRVDQNFPNPFNGLTRINYEVNKFSHVILAVYDISGKMVFNRNEGSVDAGKHFIEFNPQLAPGIYTYILTANETSLAKKMIVTQ